MILLKQGVGDRPFAANLHGYFMVEGRHGFSTNVPWNLSIDEGDTDEDIHAA